MKHGETKKPTLRRPLGQWRAGCALVLFPLEKSEGDGALDGAGAVDRRARWLASRSSRSPENPAGDHRPLTEAGAPSGAPSRRFPCCAGPRFSSDGAKRARCPSASSWQEGVVPPGGAPTQPECAAANRARGRRTGEGPELPGARHRRDFACSPAPPSIRPAITTPHESAPQRTR